MEQLKDLRTILFESSKALKDGSLTPEKAREINFMAQTLINSGKLEIDFIRATNSKNSTGFIIGDTKVMQSLQSLPESEQKPKLKLAEPKPEEQPKVKCAHDGGFNFTKTGQGMKRTCKKCGFSIIEANKKNEPTHADLDDEEKSVLKKHQQTKIEQTES